MPVNPSTKPEHKNSPIERANSLNNPDFENQQGYFNYDLTHPEFITPRFGEISPTMCLDTAPADRFVVNENMKLVRNQIQSNFLSQLNQYNDSFFVSMRSVYPNNYEKLIPNPSKGSDLPNSALPMVPLGIFFREYCTSAYITINNYDFESVFNDIVGGDLPYNSEIYRIYVGRILLLAYVLSRGQLLDYLGLNFDVSSVSSRDGSELQNSINDIFDQLATGIVDGGLETNNVRALSLSLTSDEIKVLPGLADDYYDVSNREDFRQFLADSFESGKLPYFPFAEEGSWFAFSQSIVRFVLNIGKLFGPITYYATYAEYVDVLNSKSSPFDGTYFDIGKVLAYQQTVAQYYTNDHIDNIFNSDLYMQLLRATMFPNIDGFSREPVFVYNGVSTEYDYISSGAFYASLLDSTNSGVANRQYVYMTLMFLNRRSLRYGDKFSTARPRMLAVGDLTIPVGDGVAVVDVTKNLLLQRYLNAVNYIGSGFLAYMNSQFGVTPSDTPVVPRFVGHRKTVIANQITNNTANDQGAQTTNFTATVNDNLAFDVFIDDFGYLFSVVSYDVMPVYMSGIDPSFYFADRFDFFNPMLQNMGDQPIRLSEMLGKPTLYGENFGWTLRNAEYKYKVGKAHGAFVADNALRKWLMSYPLDTYQTRDANGILREQLKISPDFIRDKAVYIDPVLPSQTGTSPGNYWHFLLAIVNEVKCARKIQPTPSILF